MINKEETREGGGGRDARPSQTLVILTIKEALKHMKM
jgi:hypothetical protein